MEPKIVTKNAETLFGGSAFRVFKCFLGAYDSAGKPVDDGSITVFGKVNTRILGTYPIIFSFIDPHTEENVFQTALVTVRKTLSIESVS